MALLNTAQSFLGTYGSWLNRYSGGMPVGFFAAIAAFESGGKMSSGGDPRLGEVGFYQVTGSFPKSLGLDPGLRNQPEWNIFFGGVEYNILAKEFGDEYGVSGADQWKYARLAFAVGRNGARKLFVLSGAKDYDGLLRWNQTHTPPQIVNQSPEKVAKRIRKVEEVWNVGKLLGGSVGSPVKVPSPDGRGYSLPRGIRLPPPGGDLLMVAALALAGYAVYRYMR